MARFGKRGSLVTQDHCYTKLESKKSAGVVDQALAFENIGDSLGNADTFGDCGCRKGICGRDDCAQYQAEFPVKVGGVPLRSQSYSDHGERNQAKSQEKDAHQVVGKFPPGGLPGGGVEQRRQDDEEDDVGIESDPGNARDEAE